MISCHSFNITGIGKAISLALGERGCKVVVNYHSNESLAKVMTCAIIYTVLLVLFL